MSSGIAVTLYLAAGVLTAILGAIVAAAKRRSPGFWTVACFLTPPLFVVLLLLPKRRIAALRPRSPKDPDSLDSDNLDNF